MNSHCQTYHFGTIPDGDEVQLVRIAGGNVSASVITWGASLQDIRLAGLDYSLTLGSSDLAAYLGPMKYFGAIVGPVANRINCANEHLDPALVDLQPNEHDRTMLHGGSNGFGERNWTVTAMDSRSVMLSISHTHHSDGFPGNIDVSVRYCISDDDTLLIEITGRTDRPTWLSPAFHGYWNLDGSTDLSNHLLQVYAREFLPVDEFLIPSGARERVSGGFDYREPRKPDLHLDHNFCLGQTQGQTRPVCRLEAAGVSLDVQSTEPGVQVYSAGMTNTAPFKGHSGCSYGNYSGIAIEPQYWPDTPNNSDYPSSRLLPGETYRQETKFSFSSSR